ncbi:hypothetical protein NP493_6g02018 [Ridgeia piscesae]|uniref:Uncharacterized protein n=1 Tax=Ridgeia piscesae TaxID=27915 RepID=A0AAD9ULG9_RIDPI|nr:hypothetical protein NP493_6g02018 [Ridgeia piscesae]
MARFHHRCLHLVGLIKQRNPKVGWSSFGLGIKYRNHANNFTYGNHESDLQPVYDVVCFPSGAHRRVRKSTKHTHTTDATKNKTYSTLITDISQNNGYNSGPWSYAFKFICTVLILANIHSSFHWSCQC